MEDAITALASYAKISTDEAAENIMSFLEVEELPELSNRPRIIITAGSFNDQELTSSILWLRTFGLDITCIELTPYKIPSTEQSLLVPRVLIPLPEAKEYLVSVARKEITEVRQQQDASKYVPLWDAINAEFNILNPLFNSRSRTKKIYNPVTTGIGGVHYEWVVRKGQKRVDVAIHFELPNDSENYKLLEIIKGSESAIASGITYDFIAEKWGRRWAHAKFHLPFDGITPDTSIAPEAATLMKLLMERTWSLIQ